MLSALVSGAGLAAIGCGGGAVAPGARLANGSDLPRGQAAAADPGAEVARLHKPDAGTSSAKTRLPRVGGTGVTAKALWQLRLQQPSVVGDTVVGIVGSRIDAVSALTGALRWSAAPPAESQVLRVAVGGAVVVVEAGGSLDDPAATIVVKEVAVYSLSDGRALWHVTVPSGEPSYAPGYARAYTAGVIVFAERAGELVARRAMTGAIVWRASAPRSCGHAQLEGAGADTRLASSGALLVASQPCAEHGREHVLVQRISLRNGTPMWQWRSAGDSLLAVVAAASQGAAVLLQGAVDDAQAFARTLPDPRRWPTALGPQGGEMFVALDARDGRPRWSEVGGQYPEFALADKALCEYHVQGVECRADSNGLLTGPVLGSGLSEIGAGTAFIGDETAGVAGKLVAFALKRKAGQPLVIELAPVRGHGSPARVLVWLGPNLPEPANSTPVVARAGTLPGGATLLFLRRLDVRGDPLVALRVERD